MNNTYKTIFVITVFIYSVVLSIPTRWYCIQIIAF